MILQEDDRCSDLLLFNVTSNNVTVIYGFMANHVYNQYNTIIIIRAFYFNFNVVIL